MMDKETNLSVSVIIVTYNSEQEIGACLKSVIPQVKTIGGEIIVVDNDSNDRTTEIVESFQQNNNEIHLIKNTENTGFSKANNQGIQKAKGEYVFFLNPDTEVRPETIEKLSFLLSTDNELGTIAPQLQFPDGRIQHSCRRFPTYGSTVSEMIGLSKLFPNSRTFNKWKMGDFDFITSRDVDQPAAAALMVKRGLLREIGGFDESFPMFFSDVDLCQRIWQTKKILFYPGAVVTHHSGASVKRVKPKMIVSSHLSFIHYFNKYHKGPLNRVLNLLMTMLLGVSMVGRVIGAMVWRKKTKRSAL